jgi:hypothetical protein
MSGLRRRTANQRVTETPKLPITLVLQTSEIEIT